MMVKDCLTLDTSTKHLLSPSRAEVYDPYNLISSDSEPEISQGQDHSCSLFKQDDSPEPQPVTMNKSHWDRPAPASRPPDRDNHGPDNGPNNSQALNPGHRLPEQQTCNLAIKPFFPADTVPSVDLWTTEAAALQDTFLAFHPKGFLHLSDLRGLTTMRR